MGTSKFKAFLRRDWQETKRTLFAKPSFVALVPLLAVGAILIVRAYRDNRRFEAQRAAMERAMRAADQQVDAAWREVDRFTADELRKRGLSEEQIREIKRRVAEPGVHTNK